MKLGIILSAGGAAFEAAAKIVGPEVSFTVITDRDCGGALAAARAGAAHVLLEEPDKEAFSTLAAERFQSEGVDACLLLFDRLVSEALFSKVPTYNIHPAALPAFPGMRAVERAHAAGVRLLGSSLHRVDATVDGGLLLAQIACGVDPAWPLDAWRKRAYLMKVYCALAWVDGMSASNRARQARVNVSHALPESWWSAFGALQADEALWVV